MEIYLISYGDSELPLIKEIIHYFSPVGICLPWGRKLPVEVDEQTLTILYPDEDLKPDIAFEKTLNDCFNWLEEQGEKSRLELVKAGAGKVSSEESLYQIRHLLAGREPDLSSPKNITNRWHLLIYLAGRIEEHRSEVNRMLDNLNKRPSPLAGNLDQSGKTEEFPGAYTEIDKDFLLENTYINHFLNAWFGLFGDIVKDGRVLLTINRQIFHGISEKWDSCRVDKEPETPLCFRVPLVSDLDPQEQEKLKSDGAIKEKSAKLKELICNRDIDPVERNKSLVKMTGEFEEMFFEDTMKNHILFTVRSFELSSGDEYSFKDDYAAFLSGKSLLLAEKVAV